ncbi:CesT family type III secretion system chaperone [Roseiconus lacunae]|uniref:CesT family type III secretion system chaperone n=1 Tax=Roseiconus lacunae TaxID=2605694 RepID=UPI001E52F6B7|nr:CesT family type III secretion system chaperone [Roseiconus lacunae]MCD0457867.1 CesT family type III secretion system chaperone [Roseiconus lacunae]
MNISDHVTSVNQSIWVAKTLGDFGESIGIDGLVFDPSGAVQLQIGSIGTLGFECTSSAVLVYLSRPLHQPDEVKLERALRLSDPEQHGDRWQHAALKGDADLIIALRLEEEEFTLQSIESAIGQLGQLHDEVAFGE